MFLNQCSVYAAFVRYISISIPKNITFHFNFIKFTTFTELMSRLLTCQALVILLFDLVFVYISIRMVLCSLPVTSWPFPSLNIYKCIFTWVTIAEQHYYSNREVAYLLKFDVVSAIAFVFWCRRSLDGKRLHFNFFLSPLLAAEMLVLCLISCDQ